MGRSKRFNPINMAQKPNAKKLLEKDNPMDTTLETTQGVIREVLDRYRIQPKPTPPFNWHEVIIGCLGEGVDDDDEANSEYRRSLVEAAALVIAAIVSYDRHFVDGIDLIF